MPITVLKKGKWEPVTEWGEHQWAAFEEAAAAQATLHDAIAYAAVGLQNGDDPDVLDMLSMQRNNMSLAAYHAQMLSVGRAEFLIRVKAGAERASGLATWFGDKVLKIEDTTDQAQPGSIIFDI